MPNVYYFAYGSNLHPLRIRERVSSAKIIGVAELQGYQLAFHKKSKDDSGKCLLYSVPFFETKVFGAIFEFDSLQKSLLDKSEGLGHGYQDQKIEVTLHGKMYSPYIYVIQDNFVDPDLLPYHWYKDMVIAGARNHHFLT